MTDAERREAVRQFIRKWSDPNKGNENQHARSYWIEVFKNILGAEDVTDRLDFEKNVIVDGHTKHIDAYIPETHVLIEQKSKGISLDKPGLQSGGDKLTPYEQAKRYNDNLAYEEKARWIVTSNFSEIWIYDMNTQIPEPLKLSLTDLQNKYSLLDFLVKKEVKKITDEMEVSIKAGEIVGILYDALAKQYGDMEKEENQKSLNALCVRLVFCLYAEDADVFGRRNMFHDYLEQFEAKGIRRALIDLFRILNTPEEERDPYLEEDLAEFPYVNGGLFSEDNMIIPPFTEEMKVLLLEKASRDFDWSDISPTIFGAVFESTLNPETRRKGGMHYTSVENIHKVIDPLFLDDLQKEFEEILKTKTPKTRIQLLNVFQSKIANLKFLDPAAGSGNFLTESYLSLRKLENEIIKEKEAAKRGSVAGQISFGDIQQGVDSPIKVSIQQFYGIEINDFACTVAKTALWIAESQMMKKTEDVLHVNLDFLPLKSYVNIMEGNALKIDWNDVVPAKELNYIMGNPPFIGYGLQSAAQKEDILSIYRDKNGRSYKTAGKIDYVAGWYWKAAELMQNHIIRAALVSTNSITQGEQVASVWEPLYERFSIHIDFAHRTFRWDSEASIMAHVHCVVIGFSSANNTTQPVIYTGENKAVVKRINPYLIDAPLVFIKSRNKPLCNVPEMTTGNRPADGGNLIIECEEYHEFVEKEPQALPYIKRLMGAKEYINNKKRYCLWLVGVSPKTIRNNPLTFKKVMACREDRLNGASDRQKLADTPALFREQKNPETYVIVPRHSSENRRYIPMGFLDKSFIPADSATIIPEAKLYHFGVLISNVHMAWMRAVAGRLKSDYRYSKDIVYNNFPWPVLTDNQKNRIEVTAQGILDARNFYPEDSLADLYDPLTMPPELQKAHVANDKAVMAAYGFNTKMTEADCVAELMKMYQKLVEEA